MSAFTSAKETYKTLLTYLNGERAEAAALRGDTTWTHLLLAPPGSVINASEQAVAGLHVGSSEPVPWVAVRTKDPDGDPISTGAAIPDAARAAEMINAANSEGRELVWHLVQEGKEGAFTEMEFGGSASSGTSTKLYERPPEGGPAEPVDLSDPVHQEAADYLAAELGKALDPSKTRPLRGAVGAALRKGRKPLEDLGVLKPFSPDPGLMKRSHQSDEALPLGAYRSVMGDYPSNQIAAEMDVYKTLTDAEREWNEQRSKVLESRGRNVRKRASKLWKAYYVGLGAPASGTTFHAVEEQLEDRLREAGVPPHPRDMAGVDPRVGVQDENTPQDSRPLMGIPARRRISNKFSEVARDIVAGSGVPPLPTTPPKGKKSKGGRRR